VTHIETWSQRGNADSSERNRRGARLQHAGERHPAFWKWTSTLLVSKQCTVFHPLETLAEDFPALAGRLA